MKDKVDKLYMHSPCGNCPFKKSEKGISRLGKKRAEGIIKDNYTEGFICHKTANGKTQERKQCSGALIIARKLNTPQPFLNMYESMFGEMELNNEQSIVDSESEFISKQVL